MSLNLSQDNLIFLSKCSVVGIVLNIVLSYTVGNIESLKTDDNSFFLIKVLSNFINMFKHHKRVLFTSSLIVAIAVFLSVLLAQMIPNF